MLKFPSASVNPTNQSIKFLSKCIDFLFDSKVRTELFFTLNWLPSDVKELVGTAVVNPWTFLLS